MPDFSNLSVRQRVPSCLSAEPFPAPKSLCWNGDVHKFSYERRGQHIDTVCHTRPGAIIDSGANFFYVTYVKQGTDGLSAVKEITFFATAGGLPSRIKVIMIDPEFEANRPWSLSWTETYDATELEIVNTVVPFESNGEGAPLPDVGSCAVWSAKGIRKPSLTSLCHPYFAEPAESCLNGGFPFCSACATCSTLAESTLPRVHCLIHGQDVDAAFPSCSFTASRSIVDTSDEAGHPHEPNRHNVRVDTGENMAATEAMDMDMDLSSPHR